MARSSEIRSRHSILLFALTIVAGFAAVIVHAAIAPRVEAGVHEPWMWFLAGTAVVCFVGGILADAILTAANAAVHRVVSAEPPASADTPSANTGDAV